MVQPLSKPHLEDRLLRDRILSGDRAAAERFFSVHFDGLVEFVHYRLAGDRSGVEDVVGETLMVAVEKLNTFDGRSTLFAWLCGIAKNKIRTRRSARRAVPIDALLDEADADIEAILGQVDSEPLPDWILERRETQELVGATLSSLPPEYRTALIGKYVDGLTVSELGQRESKSEKAAESTLQRARLAFAKIFKLLAGKAGGHA